LIFVHPAAVAEARAARLRYLDRDPAVATRFVAEYTRGIERIRAHPQRWPTYPHSTGDFRWCRFRRFPYALIYEVFPSVTHVLAVAADRRPPGYWLERK
jgi:hypothetical protein